MQIGDNLHEMSNPASRKNNKNIINLMSTEFAHKVVKVKRKSLLSKTEAEIGKSSDVVYMKKVGI